MASQKSMILDVLDVLYDVRAEVRGDVEDSVIEQLNVAINELESGLYNDKFEFDALEVLSKVLELVPTVWGIIQMIQAG